MVEGGGHITGSDWHVPVLVGGGRAVHRVNRLGLETRSRVRARRDISGGIQTKIIYACL